MGVFCFERNRWKNLRFFGVGVVIEIRSGWSIMKLFVVFNGFRRKKFRNDRDTEWFRDNVGGLEGEATGSKTNEYQMINKNMTNFIPAEKLCGIESICVGVKPFSLCFFCREKIRNEFINDRDFRGGPAIANRFDCGDAKVSV